MVGGWPDLGLRISDLVCPFPPPPFLPVFLGFLFSCFVLSDLGYRTSDLGSLPFSVFLLVSATDTPAAPLHGDDRNMAGPTGDGYR